MAGSHLLLLLGLSSNVCHSSFDTKLTEFNLSGKLHLYHLSMLLISMSHHMATQWLWVDRLLAPNFIAYTETTSQTNTGTSNHVTDANKYDNICNLALSGCEKSSNKYVHWVYNYIPGHDKGFRLPCLYPPNPKHIIYFPFLMTWLKLIWTGLFVHLEVLYDAQVSLDTAPAQRMRVVHLSTMYI